MSFLFMKNSVKRLFKIIGQADGTGIVSGRKGPELSVLMDGDISLIDTESKDYNGRICLMYSPPKKKDLYQRLFIEGQTVLVCDPTDGEENETIPLDELRVSGVVIGIVRSLDAEEKVDLKDWREFEEKFPYDPLENYYAPKYNYAFAAKKYYRGNGYSCFMSGYDYGFAEGRRAEKAAPRRKRRAAGAPQGEGGYPYTLRAQNGAGGRTESRGNGSGVRLSRG